MLSTAGVGTRVGVSNVGRRGKVAGTCRNAEYKSAGEAIKAVLQRSDASVAYRCNVCGACHVVGGRYASSLNVPQLMAEGRFLAG